MSRTAVAAPAPRPSPDEILESIARLTLRDFVYLRDTLREWLKEPEPRWTVEWEE